MKRTILAIIVAGAALGFPPLRAQERTPAAPAIAVTTPRGPRPGAEVEKLGYFIGAWASTGRILPGTAGTAGETKGRESCGWMPGRFFVGCMSLVESPLGRVQTEAIMGWDADKKVYSWTSFDSAGRHETATGTFEDGTWTWSGETKIGDKTVKSRYVVSDTTPEGYAFRAETSADGKVWKAMMDGKVTKMETHPRAMTPGAGTRTPGAPMRIVTPMVVTPMVATPGATPGKN